MTFIATRRGFLASAPAAMVLAPSLLNADQGTTPRTENTQSTLDLVDPEYHQFVAGRPSIELNDQTLGPIRDFVNSQPPIGTPNPPHEKHDITDSNAHLLINRPKRPRATPAPVILYIHGGGYILGTAAAYNGYCYDLAQETGAVVANVEYRLAPETPFPGPVEDCHDALVYLYQNATELGIDPERISVMSHSAGGGLTAALTLLARDRGIVPIRAQFPIYPMLDYRTGTALAPVNNLTTGEFIWTRQANRYGWSAMRGDYALDDERIGHFSPSLATNFGDLPPTFLICGALDLFLEENTSYALELTRARVPVEFILYPGAVHGFDIMRETKLSQKFHKDLSHAMDRLL